MNKDFNFDYAQFESKDADQKVIAKQLNDLMDECGIGSLKIYEFISNYKFSR